MKRALAAVLIAFTTIGVVRCGSLFSSDDGYLYDVQTDSLYTVQFGRDISSRSPVSVFLPGAFPPTFRNISTLGEVRDLIEHAERWRSFRLSHPDSVPPWLSKAYLDSVFDTARTRRAVDSLVANRAQVWLLNARCNSRDDVAPIGLLPRGFSELIRGRNQKRTSMWVVDCVLVGEPVYPDRGDSVQVYVRRRLLALRGPAARFVEDMLFW